MTHDVKAASKWFENNVLTDMSNNQFHKWREEIEVIRTALGQAKEAKNCDCGFYLALAVMRFDDEEQDTDAYAEAGECVVELARNVLEYHAIKRAEGKR